MRFFHVSKVHGSLMRMRKYRGTEHMLLKYWFNLKFLAKIGALRLEADFTYICSQKIS